MPLKVELMMFVVPPKAKIPNVGLPLKVLLVIVIVPPVVIAPLPELPVKVHPVTLTMGTPLATPMAPPKTSMVALLLNKLLLACSVLAVNNKAIPPPLPEFPLTVQPLSVNVALSISMPPP